MIITIQDYINDQDCPELQAIDLGLYENKEAISDDGYWDINRTCNSYEL
jgi:hypothetical protein